MGICCVYRREMVQTVSHSFTSVVQAFCNQYLVLTGNPRERLSRKLTHPTNTWSVTESCTFISKHLNAWVWLADTIKWCFYEIDWRLSCVQVENEELKMILWTSVLFYRSPDVEITACVLLSTRAIYLILDDSAAMLTNHSSKQSNLQPTSARPASLIGVFSYQTQTDKKCLLFQWCGPGNRPSRKTPTSSSPTASLSNSRTFRASTWACLISTSESWVSLSWPRNEWWNSFRDKLWSV